MSIYRTDKTNGNFTQISNNLLREMRLSSKAKYLLICMLSLPDNWVYSTEGLKTITGLKKGAITSALHELEENGYLFRYRTRSSDGRMGKSEWNIFEEPIQNNPNADSEEAPVRKNPNQAEPALDSPEADSPEVENERLCNKENNKMEQINMIDAIDRARIWREQIEFNIVNEELIDRFGKGRVNEIVDLITDAIINEAPLPLSMKSKIPWELAVERFRRLEPEHITYVLERIEERKKPIKDIKSYLLTSLYNAPTTMESYYDAKNGRDSPPDE